MHSPLHCSLCVYFILNEYLPTLVKDLNATFNRGPDINKISRYPLFSIRQHLRAKISRGHVSDPISTRIAGNIENGA
jgi:hypothetical protein